MTSSHPSSSDGQGAQSTGFALLHPIIQRWIWERAWTELRDIQEEAITAILKSSADVLIAAATASGKTEAALLPLLTSMVAKRFEGVQGIYISPLKALINDQYERLSDICEGLEFAVHRWHGDVGRSSKDKLVRSPSGLLLITPESLEAMFVLRGPTLKRMFPALQVAVVDEVHSFIGEERGRQLQSLLHRLEFVARRRVRRVGLSATLGDMGLAAEFLRPGEGGGVRIIVSSAAGQELKLQIRGYAIPQLAGEEQDSGASTEIADHLFEHLYGTENLVFCNARATVELLADRLRQLCEHKRRPNVFLPHHGSLSREVREDAERLLKEKERFVTVVCTSTLELGIDIGTVKTVAQIGPPPSVASLRQRLGRSGRRGEAAVLRIYIEERELAPDTPPQDQIRAGLVQTVAMVQLLIERWCEPPETGALHLSTLIQQILSMTAQHGGIAAADAFRVLCESGPFRNVDRVTFLTLLRALGERDVLMQSESGDLFLAPGGERIAEHRSFYAAFATPEEYRVVTGGNDLGTVPLDWALAPGMFLIFAGRRWKVEALDERRRIIDVTPAAGGKVPKFGGSGGTVHTRVRERMRLIYEATDQPAFLSPKANGLLAEARENYRRLGLATRRLIPYGEDTILFPWDGDRATHTVALQLVSKGTNAVLDGIAATISNTSVDRAADHLRDIAETSPGDPLALARFVPTKIVEKHDWLLTDDLLAVNFASRYLDVQAAQLLAARVAAIEA